MLRIDVDEPANGTATLRAEGKLVGPWVDELGRACEQALGAGAHVTLDLARASFVDARGSALLRRLRARGVTLKGCNGLVGELLRGGAAPEDGRGDTVANAIETPVASDEQMLVDALRRGDEAAFATLVERHHASMVRVAGLYARSRDVAEEVAQETWLAVCQGLDRFEGRSSLKTWLFRILTNRARTRGAREARCVPFSTLAGRACEGDDDPDELAVDPSRFLGPDHPRWPGHWATPPRSWGESPETRLENAETRDVIAAAIAALPPSQREVMTLRDIEGLGSEEVCGLLGIAEGNQRVLLHRARSKVRAALERVFGDGGEGGE